MAYEQLKNATLPRTLSDVFAGLADLFQKEMRLARAEVTSKLSAKLEAGIWMVAASALGFIALLLLVQAAVFAIASYGIALHWSCLIVAAVFGVVALLAFLKARADVAEDITPGRTLHQLKQDVATVKEHLT